MQVDRPTSSEQGPTKPRLSLKWLIGEDVFVSYSRADGLRYATALANELTRRGFACRIDQYDTSPGTEIPDHLRRSVRNCRMMVVVASDRAWASERVKVEVAEFLAPPQRGQLLLVCFGDTPVSAVWLSLAQGLPLNPESRNALEEGKPTPSLVDLIANSFQFRRRNRRLARVFAGLMTAIVLAVTIGSWRVYEVSGQLGRVSKDRDRASTERARAVAERDQAADERNRLSTENSKQRADLQASTEERDRVVKDLRVQQAEVTRQSAVNEALRSIGDVDVRRRSRGSSSPADLFAVLDGAAVLRAAGRRAEAQSALAEMLLLQPRLKAVVTGDVGFDASGVIAGGQRFVLGGSRTRVWDLASAREVASLPEDARAVAVSADGSRFLTVARPGNFVIRDARSLAVVGRWSCQLNIESPRFALSPDGSAALATCGGGARIIDVATGSVKATVPQGGYVSDLRLGKPEGYVAIVNNVGDDLDYRLSLYNAADGSPVKKGRCEAPNLAYIVDPFAQRVANSCDHSGLTGDSSLCAMEVCRAAAEKADYSLPTQARATATFSNDGRMLATSEGGLIRVWNAADGTPLSSLGLRLPSGQLRFSHDGSRLAGLSSELVWITDVSTGELSLVIDVPPRSQLVALSGDGKVVVTGLPESGLAHIWEAALARPTVISFGGLATGAFFTPDGRYLIATGKEVRASDVEWSKVLDRTSGAEVARVSDDTEHDDDEPTRSVDKLAAYRDSGSDPSTLEFLRRSLSPDTSFRLVDGGRLAISGSGSSVKLWDIRKRSAVSISERIGNDSQPALTTDGRYIAARGSTVVDLRNGGVLFKANQPVLAVSRSGLAATGEFGLVRIWRIATGALEARIRVRDAPEAVAFSPDEHEIAVAAGSRVETWRWRLEDLMRETCGLIDDNRMAAPWTALAATRTYRDICAVVEPAR